MEFKSRRFDTLNKYNHVFPTSSSFNYTYFPDQPIIHDIRNRRSARLVEVQTGIGYSSPEMLPKRLLTHSHFEPEIILHDGPFLLENISAAMPVPVRYGGGGYHHRDTGEFEAVAFRRLLLQPVSLDIALGKPTSLPVSRSKRKAPPSSPTVAGSRGFFSSDSKKIIEEWRCAMCDISVSSERGLLEHVVGKKHQAKVESLKRNNAGGDIGLGISKRPLKKRTYEIKCLKGNSKCGDFGLGMNHVKKQTPENTSVFVDSKKIKKIDDGGSIRKKFKFWCKLCKTGAHDENVMSEHKKGKKHLKNRRMKARVKKRFSDKKST